MIVVSTYPRHNLLRRTGFAAVLLGAMFGATALGVSSAYAQQQAQMTITDYGRTRSVAIETNKSMILDLPADVAEVVVSQPTVAGAIMRTTRRAIIQGILGGNTNILFMDANGQAIAVLDLKVAKEPSQVGEALEAALARILPGSHIQVDSVNLKDDTNRVVLSGTVASSQDADRALAIAVQYAGDPKNATSVLDVAGGQQVMLQVTVSEINRTVAKQLGINLSGTAMIGGSSFSFNNTMGDANSVTNSGVASTLSNNTLAAAFGGGVNINASIQALEGRGALRVLAQPTLTAISGQPAEFKAGGEFPIPVTDANGGTTVQYKDYGVTLSFTPTVKSSGLIGLLVDTGVSELQAGSNALTNRSTKTSVEMPSGATLAIGGLLQETVRQRIQQLPGLGNIPILGALFRSRDYQTAQTELVIMVTPYLVSPAYQQPALPTDRAVPASDAEAIFLGHMQAQYGVGKHDGMRGGFNGSVGFVLD
ncbi:MAG TPA: type II and III secretion system protein family protein [Devosia sp.]|nr:type II and III secretion system protein family protein [Devosia sp.]